MSELADQNTQHLEQAATYHCTGAVFLHIRMASKKDGKLVLTGVRRQSVQLAHSACFSFSRAHMLLTPE